MGKTIRIIGIPLDLGQQHRGVDELCMHTVLRKSLEFLAGCRNIHLSFDMDNIGPGVQR